MRRLLCRILGHTLHPDPGDNVLYCTRCHTMADLAVYWVQGPNTRGGKSWGCGATPEDAERFFVEFGGDPDRATRGRAR